MSKTTQELEGAYPFKDKLQPKEDIVEGLPIYQI